MPITLGPSTLQSAWCSWHEGNEPLNKRQALLLAKDALATRVRLSIDTLTAWLGRATTPRDLRLLKERNEPGTHNIFICYKGEAIAVRTNPMSRIRNHRYYLEWHWHPLRAGEREKP